jgi:cleavage stimulation factor subunit 3
LTFAYAEAQEIKKEFADVHSTYDKFLSLLHSQLETLEQTTASTSSSTSSINGPNNGSGNGVTLKNNNNSNNNNNNASATAEAGIHSAASSFNTHASDEKPSKHSELQRLRTEYGVAWIMYMRFGRRAEGVKSLRTIFGKARRDRWIHWAVYEASGLFLSLLFLSFNNQPFFNCSTDGTSLL